MDKNLKHAAELVAKWLKDKIINVLDRPPESCGLYPIESLCADLQLLLGETCGGYPSSLSQFGLFKKDFFQTVMKCM